MFSVGNNFESTSTEKQTKNIGKLIGKRSLTGFFSLNMNSMKGFSLGAVHILRQPGEGGGGSGKC